MIQSIRSVTGTVTKLPPSNGNAEIIPFRQTRLGMPTFSGNTFDDHLNAWRQVVGDVELDLWKLGAIASSLVRTHGESDVVKFGKEVGLGKSRIYEIAQTYKAFENSSRSEKLSFKHYTNALPAPDPVAAVKKAETKGWSANQLKRFVETGLEPGEKSEINIDVLAGAKPNPETTRDTGPEMKVLADRVMIDFCVDVKREIQNWAMRCPNPKFKANVFDMWIEELDDYLEKYTLDSWRKLVVLAWNKGKRTSQEIADFAGIPESEIGAVMKAYQREGLFEKVHRAKTSMGKGLHPWVWHLNGQPLGSDYERPR